MSFAIAHRPVPTRLRRAQACAQADRERLLLIPVRGGWSLTTSTGEVIVQRLGAGARRACLEYARASGILSILS